MWSARLTCPTGHTSTWEASERVNGDGRSMPVLNLLVSVWILLNGSLFGPTQVDGILNISTHVSREVFLFPFQALFQSLGLVFVSKSTHYRTMSNIIYPVVWLFWQLHQSEVIQECLVRKGNVFQKSSFFLQYPSCPPPIWKTTKLLQIFSRTLPLVMN